MKLGYTVIQHEQKQTKKWTVKWELVPKKAKTGSSAGTMMATFF